MRLPDFTSIGLTLIALAAGAHAQTTEICGALPHSQGMSATLDTLGSLDPQANDLVLRCDRLPQNTFAVFIASLSSQPPTTPMGSVGNLCVGPTFGIATDAIMRTDGTGTIALKLDLTRVFVGPGAGTTALLFGDVAFFQCWFRDRVPGAAVQSTSGFSSAVRVRLEDPPPPSFAGRIWPDIFDRTGAQSVSCVSCHGGQSPAAGLSLADPRTAYDQLVGVSTSSAASCAGPFRVAPGDPSASAILSLINDAATCSAVPMPAPGGAADILVIRSWILAGAPDN